MQNPLIKITGSVAIILGITVFLSSYLGTCTEMCGVENAYIFILSFLPIVISIIRIKKLDKVDFTIFIFNVILVLFAVYRLRP
jgi:hypothetical protein